jgi:hypothetical protein
VSVDRAPAADDFAGHLSENIAHFGRALRTAGLPIGPRTVLDAIAAVEAAGLSGREDFYWTLHAVFVTRRDQSLVFDQAFRLFWRRRALLEKMMAMMSPVSPVKEAANKGEKPKQRVADSLFAGIRDQEVREKPRIALDTRMTVSDAEILRSRDFEDMSAAELAEAKRAIDRLVLPMNAVKVRRFAPDPHGRLFDPRRTLRSSLKAGGALIDLKYRAHQEQRPPLVALCDISGSMSDYSRVFLHFLHALSKSGRTVHSFTFATELTNITRALKANKDPDEALAACGVSVRDWDGGTRISAALAAFNRRWNRRVLGQGAIVLLITDGLEREVTPELTAEIDRLHRSCRRLVWLNPLLRFDGFEALAGGIRAMLPHVDEFRTLHNLNAMADLCAALDARRSPEADPRRWLSRAA